MYRYRLLIEYHGGPFRGWQRLPDELTVQGCLEAAAAKLDGGPVEVYGAGRTDAGVHATGQVAHLDLTQDRPGKVADALNFHLRPHPICVLEAVRVEEDFHARFSAQQRHYRYVILNRRAHLTLEARLAWRVPSTLGAGAWKSGRSQSPACSHCGGILKPDVVFFGENVPWDKVQRAMDALASADALLVAGSSLMVYSGFRFCRDAQKRGQPVVIVNNGLTRADSLASLKIQGDCGQRLSTLAALTDN